ncbi:MAG: DUF6049 family protein, partial [Actinomycetota bacterium]|nr:DUF6049 family protein [Actinomycetota bacterium]
MRPFPRALVIVSLLLSSMAAPQAGWAVSVAQPPSQSSVRLVISAMNGLLGRAAPAAPGQEPTEDLTVRLLVENLGEETVENLSVVVEVFERVESRSRLHQAIDEGEPSSRLEAEALEVGEGEPLAPGDVAALEVTLEASDIGWSRRTGVYPVRVSVLEGRDAIDEVDTAVILFDRPANASVATMVGWPIDAPPWRGANGLFPGDIGADLLPGGRLERLVWTLEQNPRVNVQPLVGAHLVEDLVDLTDGFRVHGAGTGDESFEEVPASDPTAVAARSLLTRLRAVLATRGAAPLGGPYADADLAALVDGGLTSEALQSVAEGRRRIEETLSARPLSNALWATTHLTPEVLRHVFMPSRVDAAVVGWQQFAEGADDPGGKPTRTPEPVQALAAGSANIAAAVADPWLQELLANLHDAHGSSIAVQRILAETALVHLERPNAEGRGLVLLPPPDWDPPPRAVSELLSALAVAPWIQLVELENLVSSYGSRPSRARLDRLPQNELPAGLAEEIRGVRERLAALQPALPEATEEIAGRTLGELDRTLLRAPSSWWLDDDPERARALVADVVTSVEAGFGRIELPENARVTLTDTEGTIPVTVARPEGGPIQVVVVLDSSKLEFSDGDARLVTLSEGGAQTISFRTVAQASGRIPVTVQVKTPGALDPAGVPWVQLAEETLVVQSTAISGTALAVLGAA